MTFCQYILVPEFDKTAYPKPIVEHTYDGKRAADTYKKYLTKL